jgi:hypothetical protein
MNRFVEFLDKHYPKKWRPQDRSFAIELSYVDLDLVITAIPRSAPNYAGLVGLYKSDAVQTSRTIEESGDWRLNRLWRETPAFDEKKAPLAEDDVPDADWKPYPLMLPDRAVSSWGKTHPLAQIEWTMRKNKRCNGHYVNVVRSIKWWRLEHLETLPKYPKGYPLEHMIGFVLPDGIQSVAQGVTESLEQIRDRFKINVANNTVPSLQDHGVPSHNVMKRVSVQDFAAFHSKVTEAAEIARKAYDNQDAMESAEKWRRLFGKCFPLPGPRGGDRTGGFTPPSGPASPRSTERFA